jgi:Putative transposase
MRTHCGAGIGVSNHRIKAVADDGITFATKGGDHTTTLAPTEFIRRFLLHILPRGFTKMRHYGLLSPRGVTVHLARARALIATQSDNAPIAAVAASPPRTQTWQMLLLRVSGFDVRRCPLCTAGPSARAPVAVRQLLIVAAFGARRWLHSSAARHPSASRSDLPLLLLDREVRDHRHAYCPGCQRRRLGSHPTRLLTRGASICP